MNELTALIDALSKKLGVAASELYSVMQAQARLYIIKGSAWCIFDVGVIAFTCIFLKKVFIDKTQTIRSRYSEEKKVSLFAYYSDSLDGSDFIYSVLATIFIITSVLCFFQLISTLDSIVTCIFNPKFFALNQILSYLK